MSKSSKTNLTESLFMKIILFFFFTKLLDPKPALFLPRVNLCFSTEIKSHVAFCSVSFFSIFED